MAEYIKKEDAIKKARFLAICFGDISTYSNKDLTDEAQRGMETIPSIDIVHCDKCIHNVGIRDNTDFYEEDIVCDYWDCDGLCSWDYCSYGKRKEG